MIKRPPPPAKLASRTFDPTAALITAADNNTNQIAELSCRYYTFDPAVLKPLAEKAIDAGHFHVFDVLQASADDLLEVEKLQV